MEDINMADEAIGNEGIWSSSSNADYSEDEAVMDTQDDTEDINNASDDDVPYRVSGELTTYRFVDTERMQGAQSSIRSMRQYITNPIPEALIQNQYGEKTSIDAIFSDHLLRLQAKMWRELPQMAAHVPAGEDQMSSPYDIGTALAVASITDILEDGHVFVLHKCCSPPPGTQDTCSCDCSFLFCERVHAESDSIRAPYKISLEPLVDWRTVDVVDNDQNLDKIFERSTLLVYRRNLELWYDTGFDFQRYIPKKGQKVTLCLECLKFLWDRRIQSWHTMRKYPSLLESSDGQDAHGMWQTSNDVAEEQEDPYFSSEKEDTSEEEYAQSIRYSSEDPMNSSTTLTQDEEGEKDAEETEQPTPSAPDFSTFLDGARDRKRRARESSFKIWDESLAPSTTASHSFASPSPESSINLRPSLLPFTPPTQTTPRPTSFAPSPVASNRSVTLPLRPLSTQHTLASRTPSPNTALQTRRPLPQIIRYSKPWPLPRLNLHDIPSTPPSQSTTPSPPRSPTTLDRREEYQRMKQGYPPTPSPTQTICTCRLPASPININTKGNFSALPPLSQCHNPECSISWFHYRCLDRSSKISSLHNRWLCDVCKGERSWLGFQREVPKEGLRKPDMEDFERVVQSVKDGKKMLMSWKGEWTGESLSKEVDALFGHHAAKEDPYGLAGMWKGVDTSVGGGRGGLLRETETFSTLPPPPTESPGTPYGGLPQAIPYWISRAYSADPSIYGPEFVALDLARTLWVAEEKEEEEHVGNDGYYDEEEDSNGPYYEEDCNGEYYEEEQNGGGYDYGVNGQFGGKVDSDGDDAMTPAGFRIQMESNSG